MRLRVARITHALSEVGIGRGDRVALMGRNAPEYVEAFWACVSVGATAVTLNFRLATRELELLCAYAEVKAYMCSDEVLPRIRRADPESEQKYVAVWGETSDAHAINFQSIVERSDGQLPIFADVDGDEWYAIIFTGGTSGTPKAVGRSHRNVLAQLAFVPGNSFVGARKVLMACTPFFHVAGQLALFAVAAGGTIVLTDGSFSGVAFLQLVERLQVSSAFVVPAMLREIAGVDERHQFETGSLRELRSGGAPLPVELADRLVRRFPALRFSNGGGSTEAGTMGVGWWDELRRRPFGCVGRAPIGQEIRIVDEDGVECADGQIGEIVVRGAQVASSYWKDPGRSSTAFKDGWQHSADVGWVDTDGYLYLIDRISDVIISGGENVYAREVEEALFRIPRVKDAAVIGVPDERWGEVPLAVLVTSDGGNATVDVEMALADLLASYKRPRRYIVMAELPRTAVGKVDKNALRAMVKA